jgi:asparagine synthase (glutamine-hydrolysing)
VPLAFCLSGGIDSAALVSIAAKVFNSDVATFSIIDHDERYNEYDNIMATIRDLKCRHTLIELRHENVLPKLKDLVDYHDAPVATITYYIHSLLSDAISRNGYRVAFSGTAADELFTGYYDHFILHLYEMRNHPNYNKYLADWQNHIQKFIRNPHLCNPNLYAENPNMRDHVFDESSALRSYLNEDFFEPFTEEVFCASLLRNRMLNEVFHEATRVILHEDDLNSMKYSVENRSPYLDSRLLKFVYSIPSEYLIHNGYGKYLLREALSGILNDKVRLDRQKKGFNASIHSILDFNDPETKDFLLDESPIYKLVDRERIATLMREPFLPNSFSKFLFSFINAKIFLEQNG